MAFLNNLRLSVKLPLMLVVVAMLALSVTGVLAYREARRLLAEESSQRLETTLEQRKAELSGWSEQMLGELHAMAASQGTGRALRDFTGAWRRLGDRPGDYLREAYVTKNPNPPEERYKLDFPGDVNDYGVLHRRYHPGFVTLAAEKGLYDVFFVDVEGNILYSLRKEGNFAAGAGALKDTPFGQVLATALAGTQGKPAISPFTEIGEGKQLQRGFYMASPVRSAEGMLIGAVAFAVPLTRLDAVISEPRSLGATGHAYLVDAEGGLQSRLTGQPEVPIGRVVDNPAATAARSGETGQRTYIGLEGQEVQGVFAGLTLFGRPYGLLIEQSTAELFAPARALARKELINAAWSLGLLAALSALMARSVAQPLRRLVAAIAGIARGQHDLQVPGTHRRDEVGEIAVALDALRGDLQRSDEARQQATIQGTAFRNSSAALMTVDRDLKVTYANAALVKLITARLEDFRSNAPDLQAEALLGCDLRLLYPLTTEEEVWLQDPEKLPFHNDVAVGEGRYGVDFSEISLPGTGRIGYVIEWRDVTELRMNRALLTAIDNTQLVLEFSPEGRVTRSNANIREALGLDTVALQGRGQEGLIEGEGVLAGFWGRLDNLEPVIGRFLLAGAEGRSVLAEGSVTPVPDRSGCLLKIVLIANDITEAQAALNAAQARNAAMMAGQQNVVDALRVGLNRLSAGDLQSEIEEAFPTDYEQLRTDFNIAVSTLSDAMQVVIDNAQTIDGEAQEISNAAADLSQRTERQAATLAETATALDQLTASVRAATDSIAEADHVVAEARLSAENSGHVVQQAVAAMGEIEQSSQQISRIISVIDDIAFQTNLLALNAGVEAARAGEAGRGFAVVASEVRALAQRSSEAAREIDALITTSSEHVRRGVDLVGHAGEALGGILNSVNDIAGRVSRISAASREQSTGLAEINSAVIQLDQVTQQNAAMFEETTAASQALSRGAQALTVTTAQFRTAGTPAASLAPPAPVNAPGSRETGGSWPRVSEAPRVEGALARRAVVDERDWEDF